MKRPVKDEIITSPDFLALQSEPRVVRLKAALGRDADLHVVGGAVREALAGGAVQDIDCASRLLPDEIRSRLEKAGIHCVPTGLKHQTVTAVPVEGEPGIEVTTFRSAGMTPAGGVSASASIREDLRYRDFTVNALAFDLESGAIVDETGGAEDLRDKIIRAPGAPRDRFAEDPLRIMRMIRFGSKKGFRIDEATFAATRELVPSVAAVSIERIRDEFAKILLSDEPAKGFRKMNELGLLALLFPEISSYVGFEQNEYHLADLFEHTLAVIEATPPRLVLRLAALLHDIGKPATLSVDPETGSRHFYKHETVGAAMSDRFLERLRFPSSVVRDVSILVETHMRPLEAGPGGLRRLLRDTGELFPEWRILKEADASACKLDRNELGRRLSAFDEAIAEVKKGPEVSPLKNLAVDGNDILAAGVPPGPQVGVILRALHERVLDDPALNTREELLAMVPKISPRE